MNFTDETTALTILAVYLLGMFGILCVIIVWGDRNDPDQLRSYWRKRDTAPTLPYIGGAIHNLPDGVRYCGRMFDVYDLYNDDKVTGGSFVVPLGSDTKTVIEALERKRKEFV